LEFLEFLELLLSDSLALEGKGKKGNANQDLVSPWGCCIYVDNLGIVLKAPESIIKELEECYGFTI
jgi:hypothetical protein